MSAISTDQVIRLTDISPSRFGAAKNVNEIHREARKLENGAVNGIRTRDPKNHNLVL